MRANAAITNRSVIEFVINIFDQYIDLFFPPFFRRGVVTEDYRQQMGSADKFSIQTPPIVVQQLSSSNLDPGKIYNQVDVSYFLCL